MSHPLKVETPGLDISDAPFSRQENWLALALQPETKKQALYLRTARGRIAHRTMLKIAFAPLDGAAEADLVVTPGKLTLTDGTTSVEFALTETRTLRVRLRGPRALEMVMVDQPYSSSFECEPGRWHLNMNASRARLMVTKLQGHLTGFAPFIEGKSDTLPVQLLVSVMDGEAEVEITEFESTWLQPAKRPSFDAIAESAEEQFATWRAAFGDFGGDSARQQLADRAAYIMWVNIVPAEGNFCYPAVLMSQNAMTAVWSWDHCFVAQALAKAHPRQAWEQWWLPFALQTPEGMLPDEFTNAYADFGMTKPPVHGRTLLKLLKHYTPTPEELAAAYQALEKWTGWWFAHRDDDHDGIPQYNHGCESGWDNDSVCCGGLPSESPDLTVYLIEQYEALAVLAERLDRKPDAARWRNEAEELLQRLIAHSWRDGVFISPQSGTHALGKQGDCLRQFWPLLLGSRLPREMTKQLLSGLLTPGRFRTPYGFATESPRSPYYRSDGYWLGPIWAPSTGQIFEMLRINGLEAEAIKTAEDFCALCAANGFNENFEALAGTGLCDRGYAWTASVCMEFLYELAALKTSYTPI